MARFFLITWPCLLLVCCDKQGSSGAANLETSTRTKSSERSPAAALGIASRHAKPPRDMIAEADDLAPAERDKALAAVAWEAIETDQEIAHEAFGKMSPGSLEKIRLIQHYAMRLAAQNRDEAIAWAQAFENETEKCAALSQIAVALAETDPLGAANLISESGMAGREYDVAVVQVIQSWAAKNPADAAAWVIRFPPGPARKAGIQYIATRWLPADAPGAFSWLAALKDDGVRKEAALGLEEAILQQPQDIRDAWLQHAEPEIGNELEQLREKAIETVGDNIPPAQSSN